MEGWPEFWMSYLGGLTLLLEFPSKADLTEFLEGAVNSWKDWFRSLYRWNADCLSKNRIALLEIQGFLIHVWNKLSFEKIGKRWGEVVKTELERNRGSCKLRASCIS